MTRCLDVLALQSYADGDLSAAEADVVARHLARCRECRHLVAAMQITHSALAAADPLRPSPALLPEIEAAINSRGEGYSCLDIHQMISAALDNQLTSKEQAALADHLRECDDCRHYAERANLLTETLRGVPPAVPAAGLRASIDTAVDRPAGAGTIATLFPRNLRRALGAAAGLAAAVILAVVLNLAHLSAPTDMPAPVSPPSIATAPADAPHSGPAVITAPALPDVATAEPEPVTSEPPRPATPPRLARAHSSPSPARHVSSPHPASPPAGGAADAAAPPTPEPKDAVTEVTVREPGRAFEVTPLMGAQPVAIAARKDTTVATPVAAGDLPHGAIIEKPIRVVVVPDTPKTALPLLRRATLAKARPTTPVSPPAHSPTADTGAMRLASARTSWLPVSDRTRSVYEPEQAPAARLATAAERVSREVDELSHRGRTSTVW